MTALHSRGRQLARVAPARSSTGSARTPGCRRRSAPRSGRSARRGRTGTARPAGAAGGRASGGHAALLRADHLRRGQRGQRRAGTSASSWSATPAARQAARALGCSASERTTVEQLGLFRNDSRRVPKWYSSAPNRSGRTATCGCTCHGGVEVERSGPAGTGLVDTAHAVDRDLLDQDLGVAQVAGLRPCCLRRGCPQALRSRARQRGCVGHFGSCRVVAGLGLCSALQVIRHCVTNIAQINVTAVPESIARPGDGGR